MTIKSLFPGYLGYNSEEINILWDNAVFFFDANALLNLFEYKKDTFEDFVKVMNHDDFKDKFYITYQIGLEFSRNKYKRLNKQLGAYDSIKTEIDKSIQELEKNLRSNIKNHAIIDMPALITNIQNAINGEIEKVAVPSSQELKIHHEEINNFVIDIIGERISTKPTKERLKEIYSQGKSRYESEIPPGYEDTKNKKEEDRLYGDLVIWLEMINYCNQNQIKNLIFVTDDTKEDWWLRENGKTLGPRPELIQEMLDLGIIYYQYTSDRFLSYASDRIGTIVDADTISEVKDISKESYNERNSSHTGYTRSENIFLESALMLLHLTSMNNSKSINDYEFVSSAIPYIGYAIGNMRVEYINATSYIGKIAFSGEKTIEEILIKYASSINEDLKWVIDQIVKEIVIVRNYMIHPA